MFAAYLIFAVHALSATSPDPWETLRHVTWKRMYKILDTMGNCVNGQILSLTNERVTVRYCTYGKHPQPVTRTIERSSVRRIMDGEKTIDVVYSGRSSWLDVQALQRIGSDEAVLLITKGSARLKGKISRVSVNDIELRHGSKKVRIAKEDVSQVYYIREKPMGAETEHAAQEFVIFDPLLWPYMLHIPPKVSVRVYDAAMPEDNAPSGCRQATQFPP
jgi:hypothetical protein